MTHADKLEGPFGVRTANRSHLFTKLRACQNKPTDVRNLLSAATSIELHQVALEARRCGDPCFYVWLSSICFEEGNRRRRRTFKSIAEGIFPGLDIEPVPWLEKASEISARFQVPEPGNHHLYVILLDGFERNGRYGLYVGETRRVPAVRYWQHKLGIHAAGSARRMGIALLPSLYEHLNPLSRAAAKRLEKDLAECLKGSGIETRGGH